MMDQRDFQQLIAGAASELIIFLFIQSRLMKTGS